MTEHGSRLNTESSGQPLIRRGYPRLKWLLCAGLVRVLVRVRIDSLANLPCSDDGPFVIACNHRAWIDPLAIIALLGPNRPVAFLAAREHIERRAAMDRFFEFLGGVIKVERTAHNQRAVLRAANATLDNGMRLALFPEGRINVPATTNMPLLPFESGAAVIARRGGVRIVPMAVAGSGDLHFRRRITFAIGPSLPAAAHHRDDDATTELLRITIAALLPEEPQQPCVQVGKWLGRLI